MGEMDSPSPRSSRRWCPPVLAALACALFTLAYLPAIGGFFANDDWVLLYFYRTVPLSRPWEFFNPHTVWFYRPLQSVQFGLFYHLFGLNAVPYNLPLLAGHLLV